MSAVPRLPAPPPVYNQRDQAELRRALTGFLSGVEGLATAARAGDSYTKAEADALLAAKADSATTLAGYGIADAYTKTAADALLAAKANVGDSYTKAEDDALLAAKADSAASLAGYGITDAYTKTATDALFAALTAADIAAGTFSGTFTFDTKPFSSAGFRLTSGGYELDDNSLGSADAWSIFADAHRLQFFSVEAGATVFLMDQTGSFSLPLGTTKFYINNTQILETRKTGWTAATGTATRTTFVTSSVTTAQLAERVKALIDDLMAHGLIGT